METACAETIWRKSLEYKMQYKYMVSDGDSKAYNAVWDVYGVCDDCSRYEKMNKNSEEYLAWKNSNKYKKWEDSHMQGTADCCRVIKLDCVGHVQRGWDMLCMSYIQKVGNWRMVSLSKGNRVDLLSPPLTNYKNTMEMQ